MDSPIFTFAKKYADSENVRMHMPGHKGTGPLGIEKYDLTEIDGADNLYSPDGIIGESEKCASRIFGAYTYYSTEGSSLSIRAMLYLLSQYSKSKGEDVRILAARNVHRSFISGVSLLGIEPTWIEADGDSYLSVRLDAKALDEKISAMDKPPHAVYITSPDYLGHMHNIREIADTCHKFGSLLLVDNAHGAYLKFVSPCMHPIDLGADVCADSAHKTLPAIGGAAYLHVSKSAPEIFREWAKDAMLLFGSTSPSYLILESLDLLNAYLQDGIKEDLKHAVECADSMREKISKMGFDVLYDEPLKLTVMPKSYGYTGEELASILRNNGIYVEYYDPDYTVLMLSVRKYDGADRVLRVLSELARKSPIKSIPPAIPHPVRKISPREAVLSPKERVLTSEALYRVASDVCISCPPAIPIVVSGEVIDENVIKAAEYYGIDRFTVTKG